MLWMDYCFYLSKLPEEERINQILLLIGFFIVLFIIGGLVNLLDINPIKRDKQFKQCMVRFPHRGMYVLRGYNLLLQNTHKETD